MCNFRICYDVYKKAKDWDSRDTTKEHMDYIIDEHNYQISYDKDGSIISIFLGEIGRNELVDNIE